MRSASRFRTARVALALALSLVALRGSAGAAVAPAGGSIPRELAGSWSVLAGDRTAPGNFQNPTGLAVDAQGNVYVDDTQNFRIEKLTPTGQILAAFGDAGNGDGQFRFANGLTVDRAGNVYVADTENSRIQKFSPRGLPLGTWGQYGSNPGQMQAPSDVAVDRSGNMYVADWGTHRVEKLSSQGKPLAMWGSAHPIRGGLKLVWPSGVAVSNTGTIYVSDKTLGTIAAISPQGKVLSVWGGGTGRAAEFVQPQHLALDSAGHVFVSDSGHHRVVELSAAGKELRSWKIGAQANPSGIAVTPAGTLLVSDTRGSRVLQYSQSGSRLLSTWGRSERARGELFYPTAVALGPASTLDVADEGNGRVEQVPALNGAANPRVIWNISSITASRIKHPVSVAADAAGDLYVVGARAHGLAKLLPNGNIAPGWPAARGPLPADPIGVALDAPGNVYVADAASEQIWRFNAAGRLLARWGQGRGRGAGQFHFDPLGPAGIAIDGRGQVYVTDTRNNRIEKFSATGTFLSAWDGYGGFGDKFYNPYGVATDARGNVYVTEANAEVAEVSPKDSLVARWGSEGSAAGQFRDPNGIAVDAAGRIYVADSNNDRIQVFTPSPTAAPAAAVRVSAPTSIFACKLSARKRATLPYEAETRVAVNPATVGTGQVNLIGAWIQGFALDDFTAHSNDGGATWQETPLPFSQCVPGGLPFATSGDPWVSIGPDGTAYVVGIGDTYKKGAKYESIVDEGIELATSTDGGRTWGNVRMGARITAAKGVNTVEDKPTVAADPAHPGTAYVFWDSVKEVRPYGFTGWMIKTTDGGRSWTAPAAFLPAQPLKSVAALHQAVIDPRTGTLYDFFSYARTYPAYTWHCHKVKGKHVCGSARTFGAEDYIASVRSTDGGATWSAPHVVGHRLQGFLGDFLFGAPIRDGVGFDAAIDPANGSLHVVWGDTTATEGQYDQLLTSASSDGGATWTQPARVTQLPAFNPSIAVNASGTVAITYYAVRHTHSRDPFRSWKHPTALVTYMMQTSSDGATFSDPRPVYGAFDVNRALPDGSQFFLGDYQGLAAEGNVFHPFFVAGNPGKTNPPVDVYTSAIQP